MMMMIMMRLINIIVCVCALDANIEMIHKKNTQILEMTEISVCVCVCVFTHFIGIQTKNIFLANKKNWNFYYNFGHIYLIPTTYEHCFFSIVVIVLVVAVSIGLKTSTLYLANNSLINEIVFQWKNFKRTDRHWKENNGLNQVNV